MRRVYVALLVLLFAAIAVQFYLAAVGAYDNPHTDSSFAAHRVNGSVVIPALSIIATIVAAIAKAPRRLVVMTIVPVGLILLQFAIDGIAESFNTSNDLSTVPGQIVFGLHAINGLAVMVVTREVIVKARKFMAAPAVAEVQSANA